MLRHKEGHVNMLRRDNIEKQVQYRVGELCQNMHAYLDFYEEANPFKKPGQLELHVQTIELRRKLGNVSAALHETEFIESLWKTLEAWGLNTRGAKLVPLEKFNQELLSHEKQIAELDGAKIDDPNLSLEKTAEKLWKLITTVKLSNARNPIVMGSKTIHHILPDLVPPIDREYTRPFFMFWM